MKDKIIQAIFDKGFLKMTFHCIGLGFGYLWHGIDFIIKKIVMLFMTRNTPINQKKIVFCTFSWNYTCNPKAICEKIIEEGLDYELVLIIGNRTQRGESHYPREVTAVRRNSLQAYQELASAKIIIENSAILPWLHYSKRKGQTLIQTWHGSIGIKKFDKSTNKSLGFVYRANISGKTTDYIISNSDFEDKIYRDSFWPKTPILKFGHARNDILFEKDKNKLKPIKEKFYLEFPNIPKENKLCLYGPTFRDDGDISPFDINYSALSKALKVKFGGDWTIITKFHPRTLLYINRERYVLPLDVVDVSEWREISELMPFIDCGITDYSNWICEYVLTRKPGFIYASDIDTYEETNRTLSTPLEELPFPVASTTKGLIKNISSFNNEQYVEDCNAFLKKHGSVDDGHAAERAVEKIKELMKQP